MIVARDRVVHDLLDDLVAVLRGIGLDFLRA
jgi:hypothetical protein